MECAKQSYSDDLCDICIKYNVYQIERSNRAELLTRHVQPNSDLALIKSLVIGILS